MKIKAFTSDPHYGHEPIIKFCDRPFYSLQHMQEELIARYNTVIGKDDTCVWVGDAFFVSRDKITPIMQKLNGRKVLVRGNHDKGLASLYHDYGFDLVVDNHINIDINGTNVKVCHYPYSTTKIDFYDKYANIRPKPVENEILIHGHTHSKEKYNIENRTIHVGVDAHNYYPVTFNKIICIIEEINKKWEKEKQ